MSAEDEVRQAEAAFNAALTRMIEGDGATLKALLSRAEDATAFLGWGGYERGWDAIDARWEWAAAQFVRFRAEGRTLISRRIENLATVADGNLAYTTSVERATFSGAGGGEPVEQALRLTHIYRREDGSWKLVHRHADRLVEQRDPA